MSVTSVGVPTMQPPPPWSGPSGDRQVSQPNDRNSGSAVSNAADAATANGTNPLPPVQAATTPGTGQKVNVIA